MSSDSKGKNVNIINYKKFPINLRAISEDLTEECLKELKELFFIEGRYSPIIRWCSSLQSDWPDAHKVLFDSWRNNDLRDIDLNSIKSLPRLVPLRGSLSVCEVVPGENDFRYVYIGEKIKAAGALFREGVSVVRSVEYDCGVAGLFLAVCLGACELRAQPLLTLYQSSDMRGGLYVRSAMIVPVTDAVGKVTGFVSTVLMSGS